MRTASMVLGITGGVFGILSGLIALMVGGLSAAFGADGGGLVAFLAVAAIMISVMGIVGGALAPRRPGVSFLLQGGAFVLGFIAISVFWVLAGLVLLAGSLISGIAWLQASNQSASGLASPKPVTDATAISRSGTSEISRERLVNPEDR